MNLKKFHHVSGQAIMEIAIFGAVLIFLIGIIIRSHLSTSQNQAHQVKALKMALLASFKGNNYGGNDVNNSRSAASILFVEDRLTPDLNKFNTIDRTPFIASGSATMSNRLNYPIDIGEVQNNLPTTDLYINGQHFPLTTAGYAFRPIYQPGVPCNDDWLGVGQHGPEYYNCLRQQKEWVERPIVTASGSGTATYPLFFNMSVNGTSSFCYTGQNCNFNELSVARSFHFSRDWSGPSLQYSPGPDDPNVFLHPHMAWQWYAVGGVANNVRTFAPAPSAPLNGLINFGTNKDDQDEPNYPSLDVSGSRKEQTIYAITFKTDIDTYLNNSSLNPYKINGRFLSFSALPTSVDSPISVTSAMANLCLYNPKDTDGNPPQCPGTVVTPNSPITGALVLDGQLGDIDTSYDKNTSSGPQPGLMPQMSIFTWINPGTYLEIKEGKLYNPETHAFVRSISGKDHIDLVSHPIQLSNNTGRFCQLQSDGGYKVQPLLEKNILEPQKAEVNPVKACSDCWGANINVTCMDPSSRILYVRTSIGDKRSRQWFTDITKGM